MLDWNCMKQFVYSVEGAANGLCSLSHVLPNNFTCVKATGTFLLWNMRIVLYDSILC